MANIDLDAAKRARAEKRGGGNTLTFGGVTFELPAELGYEIAEALTNADWHGIMAGLLGEEQAKVFFDLHPSVDDLRTLLNGDEGLGIDGIMSLYATDEAGESQASSEQSNAIGNGSRQDSSLSTTST